MRGRRIAKKNIFYFISIKKETKIEEEKTKWYITKNTPLEGK
jgi:hypothetical protein